tara:strand:+ start:21 stop:311 length:291 start_codon:yes stop_codon:yes gene_type:complete
MEVPVTFTQTRILEQPLGIPFDSTDFTMNIAQHSVLMAIPPSVSMEELSEDEEDNPLESETDQDVIDEDDDVKYKDVEEEEEDETFEQYLFGEDDD